MTVKTQTETKLQPLANRVVVEPVEAEEVTSSGLYIPDTAKEKQQKGLVVSVGKGKYDNDGKLIPMEVKAGDKVLYGKYSGTEIKVSGTDLLIISEDDILAIVK